MKKRILFYCQPVLGIGHYIRSREIVRVLSAFDVCFVNGGEIVAGLAMPAGVEVVNLPALKSDADFQTLRTSEDHYSLDEIKSPRKQQLLEIYDRCNPDAVIIELFPFGRRKFDFELIPLLEKIRASSTTKIVCSLRDILVSKRNQAQFEIEACDLMNRYFDLLLIHSDPNFQRLEETFPHVSDITCEIRYTGFVAQALGPDSRPATLRDPVAPKEIIVSIGGGRVGKELIDCAIAAANLLAQNLPCRMHIVTGPHFPDEDFLRLQTRITASPSFSLERFTPNFPAYLRRADLSISMAGYNTCMDILSAGVRAIVFPFTGNNNQEQTMRAQKLEKTGAVKVIHQLKAENLASLITQTLSAPAPNANFNLNMHGAEATAKIISEITQA